MRYCPFNKESARLMLVVLMCFIGAHATTGYAAKPVFGRFEYVRITEAPSIVMNSLVDSGAETSAIDARRIRTHMSRSGNRWVYFQLLDNQKKAIELNLPINRIARVLSHNRITVRPVVNLTLTVGSLTVLTEVSLINRSAFPQPLLLGRNFLNGRVLIDTSDQYLQGGER